MYFLTILTSFWQYVLSFLLANLMVWYGVFLNQILHFMYSIFVMILIEEKEGLRYTKISLCHLKL